MIITTLSHSELLPSLRSVVKGQADALPSALNAGDRIKDVLGRISISRVFDFDGLREALDELDRPAETGPAGMQAQVRGEEPDVVLEAPRSCPGHQAQSEIRDSEDEDEDSSLSSPSSPQPLDASNKPREPSPHQPASLVPTQPHRHQPIADIVLITNLTALVTSLYTTRDRRHVHRMLRHLSSRLRYLSRSPSHGAPLFLLLNSTTSKRPSSKRQPPQENQPPSSTPLTPSSSAASSLSPSPRARSPSDDQRPLPEQARPRRERERRREEGGEEEGGEDGAAATTRSVFNPRSPSPTGGRDGAVDEYGYARHHPNPRSELLARLARRNRPFLGARFDALVQDVHLLATRVPKTDADADVFFAGLAAVGGSESAAGAGDGVRFVWVVEVLGDGVGVWVEDVEEEDGEERGMAWGAGRGGEEGRMGRRFNREQRWAGVEVREERGGVRVVDALGI